MLYSLCQEEKHFAKRPKNIAKTENKKNTTRSTTNLSALHTRATKLPQHTLTIRTYTHERLDPTEACLMRVAVVAGVVVAEVGELVVGVAEDAEAEEDADEQPDEEYHQQPAPQPLLVQLELAAHRGRRVPAGFRGLWTGRLRHGLLLSEEN